MFFVWDKIRFVQDILILSMTKYFLSRTKILSMASNKFPHSKDDFFSLFQFLSILFLVGRISILIPNVYELSEMDQILDCSKSHFFAIPKEVEMIRIISEFLFVTYCSLKLFIFYLGTRNIDIENNPIDV